MSEQIDNLEEDSLDEVRDPSSPKEKDRESRSSVRKELREQRQLLRELRRRFKILPAEGNPSTRVYEEDDSLWDGHAHPRVNHLPHILVCWDFLLQVEF